MGHGVESVEITIADGSDVEALNEPPSAEVEIEMGKIIAEEICGEESSKNKTVFTLTDDKIVAIKNEKRGSLALRNFFYAIFLPEGFPASVSSDYGTFQIFNTVADFCSGVMGTIATQSIMQGLGVGATATTALAATMTLILKDGIGMIGRIIFAWAKGTNLDYELKRWKIRADILNNLAIFLEVISPLAGTNFLYVVCFSALLRAVIGVTVAGIKPAILQHQAQRNNIGDVAAHNSSQETLAAIAALIVSLCVMPFLTLSPWLSWSVFVCLVVLHLVANYCGLRSLFFQTFNPVRFHIAVRGFLQSGKTHVPSMRDVNMREPILATFPRKWQISVGDPVPKHVLSTENLSAICLLYEDEPYALFLDKHSHRLHVMLASRADQEDILKGVFEAEYILSFLKEGSEDIKATADIMQQCHEVVHEMFGSFKKIAELQGWTFRHASMGIREYRVNWRTTSVMNGNTAHVKDP
ncbi:hypothetical protein RvY_13609-2 [Ramazzottius varieornatus]|uniref:DUF647 domain-containing protein n=1 Tax=Ramazzottius varieornatus TaxID=947166 RepID=A0A1D1VVW9_RAMVA|nr:hypothetical protein RvY_13609-2 [Ramazzottius varieornatus]